MDESNPVVVAEKCLFKGQIHGAASKGGAVINISHGKAIKFIANNDKSVTIQIIDSGIGQPIKNQSWVKPKATKQPKKEIHAVNLNDDVKTGDLL